MSGAPPASSAGNHRLRSAADDYREKVLHETSVISRTLRQRGYPAPLGYATSGIMLLVEQPIGPRILDAVERSLRSVSLPDAYVTWSFTGLLMREILAVQPSVVVAVGPGAARDLDELDHPLSQSSFGEATVGAWFHWTKSTSGLLLPALAPALEEEKAKKRFWRNFLNLRALAASRP